MGESLVHRLSEGLHGVGRVMVMDNFFTSLKLFMYRGTLTLMPQAQYAGIGQGSWQWPKARKAFDDEVSQGEQCISQG